MDDVPSDIYRPGEAALNTPRPKPKPRPKKTARKTNVSKLSSEGFAAAILAGMVLDMADLVTMLGGRAGLFIGAAAALYLCYDFRVPLKRWPWFSALGALYCMLPMTFLIPIATTISLTNYMMRTFGVLDEWRKKLWEKI